MHARECSHDYLRGVMWMKALAEEDAGCEGE